MSTLEKIGLAAIVTPLIIGIIAILLVLPTWWAWNTFMTSVFGLPSINGWQAFALTLLTSLFRSMEFKTKNG